MFPQKRRPRWFALAAAGTVLALTAACSSGGDDEPGSGSTGDGGTPSGDLTVITWRTDLLENGTLDQYKDKFNETYPDVNVTFEGITDYEGDIATRMNTDDYGDVLAIPNSVTPAQLPDFFEPLGDQEEMSKEYRQLAPKSYEGKSYGIPVVVNAQGFVYNTKVWEAAGITDWPTTPEEFNEDLGKIKAASPDTVPLYTNYADKWPVTQWDSHRGEISADPDFNNELAEDDAPWADGKDLNVIDTLVWDAVHDGYTEDDPTTTNWEQSKNLIGTGKVATMILGSWAIVQMQDAAEQAGESRDVIGYMPFPAQVDGKFHSVVGGDYNLGINVHSKNKAAARAWVDFFINDSGYAAANQGIPAAIDGEMPSALQGFADADVQYLEMNPAPAGKESLVNDIDKQSEIGLSAETYPQRIIDSARGASGESLQQIFDDLNSRWKDARATVAG